MSELVMKKISKVYDNGHKALDEFNLEIKDKEFIVLVGPSGCGKSTLLRIIAGLEEITEGELYIDDKIVNDLEPKDRDIAMVFQNYALYPHKNVYSNLSFGLKIRKIDKKIIDEKVKKVAKMLDLEEVLYRKPSQLSGGQKQRVALGRAIIREPKVFLMDEPLSNLDVKLRASTRAQIHSLQKDLQTTMVYVTHDQVEAMTMGDRIVVMNDGVIQQIGTPDEVYRNPRNVFVAEFIGSPMINIIKLNSLRKYINIDKNFEKEDILVGVRPENIELIDGDDFDINLIENLGSEKLIYLKNESDKFTVKICSSSNFELKEKVSIKIKEEEMLNYFDEETKKSINL